MRHAGKNRPIKTLFTILQAALLASGLLFTPQGSVSAAAELAVYPITWNVVGLDSNNVNVGPNVFPVGARVCNEGDTTATNLVVNFNWANTTNSSLIYSRQYSLTSLSYPSLTVGACRDFYYEIEIARNSAAYDKTRPYYISVTADGLGMSYTPTLREIYVEHLVSQSRNYTYMVYLDGELIPPGGTMGLIVGETYTIRLEASTATNGYEQIESYINFLNTYFRINSVSTDYTAYDSTSPDPWVVAPDYDTVSKVYADGCNWVNDPGSPNYRSCSETGKYGGDIIVTYDITIIGGAGKTETLSSLVYDFSGSSYHYNSDYLANTRFISIIDPASLTISKNFSPDPTIVNGVSRLTFTIINPNGAPLTGLNFTDTLPALPGPEQMTIANPANVSTAGCGTPTVSASAGGTTISFSDGSIGANSTCVIGVNVTAPAVGTYENTSDHLYLGTTDTGNYATDTLTVNNTPPPPPPPTICVTPTQLAYWSFENFTADTTPDNGPFAAFSENAGVTNSIGVYGADNIANTDGDGISYGAIVNTSTYLGTMYWDKQSVPPATTGNSGNSWGIAGGWETTTNVPTSSTFPYFQFQTSSADEFGGYGIGLSYNLQGNWSNSGSWYVYSSTDSATWSQVSTGTWSKANAWQINAITGQTAETQDDTIYFRVYFNGAQNDSAAVYLDSVEIFACAALDYDPPTIAKSFAPDPVAVNGVSTLTFTIYNPNPGLITGVVFEDILPAGLEVAADPNASTSGCGTPTFAPTAGATSLSFSNGTIAATSTCRIYVDIKATIAGPHTNISGFISSTETGTNNGANGYATDTLTAILPPYIEKVFSPNPIPVGNISTITFTITNPNQDDTLSGVAFTDTYPSNLVTAAAPNLQNTCGGTVTPIAGGISLTGGSIAAGSLCTIEVDVTSSVIGSYENTTGNVSATTAGTGNTASDTLVVTDVSPSISLLKRVSTTQLGPWSPYLTVAEETPLYFQFLIENTGDVPLTNLALTDPNITNTEKLLIPTSCAWVDGNGIPFTITNPLPVADADDRHIIRCVLGPVTAVAGDTQFNTATASGVYGGATVQDSSTASYGVPALTLAKSSPDLSFHAAGDILDYSYLVTNTGGASLPGPVTISDNKSSNAICPDLTTIGDLDTYFDPGESLTCTGTYTVTEADVTAGFVENTAHATVGGYSSNEDTVRILLDPGFILIDKVTDPTGSLETFEFDPSWSGTNFTLTDTDAPYSSGPLAQGTYTVTELEKLGWNLSNLVCNDGNNTVDLTSRTATIVLDASETVTCTFTNTAQASLTIVKNTVGGNGTFTFTSTTLTPASFDITTVGNTGSRTFTGLEPGLYDVDETVPSGWDLTSATCDNADPITAITLAAGENVTCTFVDNQLPTVDVTKTADPLSIPEPSADVTYTISVTNTSDEVVTLTSLIDNIFGNLNGKGNCVVPQSIASGENYTCSFIQNLMGSGGSTHTNRVTATVTDSMGATASDFNEEVVTFYEVIDADLSLTKGVNDLTPEVGSTIDFTVIVTNGGPEDATGIVVTDQLPNGYTYVSSSATQGSYSDTTGQWTVGDLTVGGSATLTITVRVNVSGTYTNFAEITTAPVRDPDSTPGNGPQTPPEDDEGTVTPEPFQNDPQGLAKTLDATSHTFTSGDDAAIGEILTFRVEITIPPGEHLGSTLVDLMGPGLAFVECVGIDGAGLTTDQHGGDFDAICANPTVDANGSLDPQDVDSRVTFYFGKLTNSGSEPVTLSVVYDAVVLDILGNQDPGTLTNTATWTWDPTGELKDSYQVQIVEPDLAISKASDVTLASVGTFVNYTVTIEHTATSHTNAYDVVVSDTIPVEVAYVPGFMDCTLGGQAATTCSYDDLTRTVTATWDNFSLTGGTGVIRFRVQILTLPAGASINNTASVAWTSLPDPDGNDPQSYTPNIYSTERWYDPGDDVNIYGTSTSHALTVVRSELPGTGFAPGVITDMRGIASASYSSAELWMEIPALGVQAGIVGVPLVKGDWNVAWLWNKVGWLEGSAYPTWNGNSVLTAHNYVQTGAKGPFVNLGSLRWGDRVVIHAGGSAYTYEVRSLNYTDSGDLSVFTHKDQPWLTLVTCRQYDESSGTYLQRVVVQAVLVKVTQDDPGKINK